MIRLFEAALVDGRLVAAMPKDADGKANPVNLGAVLTEFLPLCCFVTADAMAVIYAEAGVDPPD